MFEDDGGSQQAMILEKIMELLSQLPDKEDEAQAKPEGEALMVVAEPDKKVEC